MWPALIGEFYGHFLFHYHTILLLCSYTRRLWEASLGKYDNWCLFIVIEICSTAQWNTTPQRLWLAAPGPETSKIIQISTTSSWPSNHFLMFYTKMRVSSHYALDSGCFPLCVQICAHSFSCGMGWCKAFGEFSQQQWKCTFKIYSCSGILVLNILRLSLTQTALKCQCVMHMFCHLM